MLHRALRFVAPVLFVALVGCPPSGTAAGGDAGTGACTKLGQTCEVSPGKLGSCVSRDDCANPAGCFVCQSQH